MRTSLNRLKGSSINLDHVHKRLKALLKSKGRLDGLITSGNTVIRKLKDVTAEVEELVEAAKADLKGCRPHFPPAQKVKEVADAN